MSENSNRRSFLKKSVIASAGTALMSSLNEDSSSAKATGKTGKEMICREKVREALTGPIMSLRTPFKKNGEIDYRGVGNLIDFTIDGGTKTIITTYGDSLYSLLTDKEIVEITKFVVGHTAGRAMVVAADRDWGTVKAIEYAKYCREVGADILMTKPPNWAHSCTSDTLVEHYTAVAEHIPVMIVTNVFEGYSIAASMDIFRRLRDVNRIYAVKDDLVGEFAKKLGVTVNDRMAVFCGGSKKYFLDARPYGCTGYFSIFIQIKPSISKDFWRAVETNDNIAIKKIMVDNMMPLWDYIGGHKGSFNAALHGMQELVGITERWIRKPYYSLNDVEMEKMKEFMMQKGWKGVVEFDCHMLRTEGNPKRSREARKAFIRNCSTALTISLELGKRIGNKVYSSRSETVSDYESIMKMCNLKPKFIAKKTKSS